MEVTRAVIEDLLPLYLAGEASEDTVALVKSYLETDSQLADEYRKLTGCSVQVPSRQNPGSWWAWRCDLQVKVMQARLHPSGSQAAS